MKKNINNIETLKAMINANDLEILTLSNTSVQVYNLNEGEEYVNIYKVEKVSGRYYMYDIAGRRYLICRQRDAEWFAGEFIGAYEAEGRIIANYINAMKKHGVVTINAAYWSRFSNECAAQGIDEEYVKNSMQYVQNGWQEYIVETHRLITSEIEPETEPETTTETPAETTAETEPEDDGRELRTPDEQAAFDRYQAEHIDEVAPFIIWQVMRQDSGDIVARIGSRSASHTRAINRMKGELNRLATAHGITWQKHGKGYFFTYKDRSCMMCVTKAAEDPKKIFTQGAAV